VSRLQHGPLGLKEANRFVGIEHRHCKPVRGYKFAIGAWLGAPFACGRLVGVAIIARTIAKGLHHPLRAEITRLATDGTWNACSFLYQRAKRIVQAMGYVSLKTYTRTDESGGSLRAIGACCEAELEARSWKKSSKKRKRIDQSEPARRLRWELLEGAA
jgi:hypothetical protein